MLSYFRPVLTSPARLLLPRRGRYTAPPHGVTKLLSSFMKGRKPNRTGRTAAPRRTGHDPTLEYMRERGLPLTLKTYLELYFLGQERRPLEAEEEAMLVSSLPSEMREQYEAATRKSSQTSFHILEHLSKHLSKDEELSAKQLRLLNILKKQQQG